MEGPGTVYIRDRTNQGIKFGHERKILRLRPPGSTRRRAAECGGSAQRGAGSGAGRADGGGAESTVAVNEGAWRRDTISWRLETLWIDSDEHIQGGPLFVLLDGQISSFRAGSYFGIESPRPCSICGELGCRFATGETGFEFGRINQA